MTGCGVVRGGSGLRSGGASSVCVDLGVGAGDALGRNGLMAGIGCDSCSVGRTGIGAEGCGAGGGIGGAAAVGGAIGLNAGSDLIGITVDVGDVGFGVPRGRRANGIEGKALETKVLSDGVSVEEVTESDVGASGVSDSLSGSASRCGDSCPVSPSVSKTIQNIEQLPRGCHITRMVRLRKNDVTLLYTCRWYPRQRAKVT
jgi:hypothetical protein